MDLDRITKLFRYGHLPEHLQRISSPLHSVAMELGAILPQSAERTLGLRLLWDAKNYLVYAAAEAAEPDLKAGEVPAVNVRGAAPSGLGESTELEYRALMRVATILAMLNNEAHRPRKGCGCLCCRIRHVIEGGTIVPDPARIS